MFWSKKPKKAKTLKSSSAGAGAAQKNTSAANRSAEIRAQAMANARAAREAIGDETLQKIAAAIQKKQASVTERAKDQIKKSDPERVAEEILYMLETRH